MNNKTMGWVIVLGAVAYYLWKKSKAPTTGQQATSSLLFPLSAKPTAGNNVNSTVTPYNWNNAQQQQRQAGATANGVAVDLGPVLSAAGSAGKFLWNQIFNRPSAGWDAASGSVTYVPNFNPLDEDEGTTANWGYSPEGYNETVAMNV